MSGLKYGARPRSLILQEGLDYIDARRQGLVTSFRTPWVGLNKAGINGLEWGNMLTIGARPGSGKTMIVSQILREGYLHNPTQQYNILEFQFEMGAKQYASRVFAAQLAMDYNLVLSSRNQLDEYSFQQMQKFQKDALDMEKKGINWMLINDPLTVGDMEGAIEHYHSDLGNHPMIVTIDHSWLIKKGASEKDKFNTLYNTAEMLMNIKNRLPIIVIILTQLTRTIDEASRKIPNTIGNYPTSNDIFGGDALMQASDMLIALNRPAKFDIQSYGPKGYTMGDKDIAMHLLKVRNSADDVNMLFFRAEFDRQRMVEVAEPTSQFAGGAPGSRFRRPNGVVSDTGPQL